MKFLDPWMKNAAIKTQGVKRRSRVLQRWNCFFGLKEEEWWWLDTLYWESFGWLVGWSVYQEKLDRKIPKTLSAHWQIALTPDLHGDKWHSLEDIARDYEPLDRRWRTQRKGELFIPSCWRPRVWKGEKKTVWTGCTDGTTENCLDSLIMGYISEIKDSGPYENRETGVQKIPYQSDPEGFNWILSGRWGISPKIVQSKS